MNYEKKYNKAVDKLRHLISLLKNNDVIHDDGIIEANLFAIFPELRESDDERIIEEIKFAIMQMPSEREDTKQRCLAYLERQKEQKHYCPSSDELEDAAREFRGKCLPPIEPVSDELVEIIKGEFEGFRNLLKKKGIDYEPQRGYWEGFARLFDSSAREYVKEQKPAEKQNYSSLTDFERAIHRGFLCAGVVNVPVTIIRETAQECMAKIKPAEWSDEDEQFLLICKNALRKYQTSDHWDANIISNWLEKRLKSLRPKSKVDSVEYERGFLAGQGSIQHWKPSKEQMKALNRVANNGLLLDLFNDLLKLK